MLLSDLWNNFDTGVKSKFTFIKNNNAFYKLKGSAVTLNFISAFTVISVVNVSLITASVLNLKEEALIYLSSFSQWA
jgi:hypothetical protein